MERYKVLGAALHTLTPAACRAYLDFLICGLKVVDQIQVERRLVAAEQAALEAGRYSQAKMLQGPASSVEVEVPPGSQASGWTGP